jgi:hypothetical protein
MATADKTRQKLLDSMRKSKSGAAGKPSAGSRTTTAKKSTARRAPVKPATRSKPASAGAAMPAITQLVSSDPYQSNGRIWPD